MYVFVSSFFYSTSCIWDSLVLLCVPVIYIFLSQNAIALGEYTTISLVIVLLMNIWVLCLQFFEKASLIFAYKSLNLFYFVSFSHQFLAYLSPWRL